MMRRRQKLAADVASQHGGDKLGMLADTRPQEALREAKMRGKSLTCYLPALLLAVVRGRYDPPRDICRCELGLLAGYT